MTRKKISKVTEATVLCLSRRRCCICSALNRDFEQKTGQIAHLDHNPSHNKQDNLAYLCLIHHDQYDTKTKQSKNLTLLEVKNYRKQLYEQIGVIWKEPITFNEISTDTKMPVGLTEKIAGHYIIDGEYESAELDIDYLKDNIIKVQGFALWGKTRKNGPNIGELDFEAELKCNKVNYSHAIGDNKEYQLELEFKDKTLKVNEKYSNTNGCSVGMFGMNVSFQGVYKKSTAKNSIADYIANIESNIKDVLNGNAPKIFQALAVKELADRGEEAVPVLIGLAYVNGNNEYKNQYFPSRFEALWGLGKIASKRSICALRDLLDSDYKQFVSLILKKIEEKEKGNEIQIIFLNTALYEKPSINAKMLIEVKSGEFVKCLEGSVVNKEEEGPRGGRSMYEKVQLINSGYIGYVKRSGDDLTPFV